MNNSLEDFEEELKALEQAYLAHLPEKIEPLKLAWATLNSLGWGIEQQDKLMFQAHTLAGSAGTFGLTALSQAARALEIYIKSLRTSSEAPAENQLATLNQYVEEVLRIVTGATAAPLLPAQPGPVEPPPNAATSVKLAEEPLKVIYLVQEQPDSDQDLGVQLGYFGYQVQFFQDLNGLQAAIEQLTPTAIIVDLASSRAEMAYIEAVRHIQQELPQPVPVLFITTSNDLTVRLASVRAGGVGYFNQPIDFNRLIDQLDGLSAYQDHEPYRILIIEDDRSLAAYYEATLRHAGMLTTVVTDPLEDRALLAEATPDLILMDIYMPNCNGLELAAVIRQQEAYVSIPIVFLSGETNLDKQMEAMLMGGDDFLTKPIKSNHLISSVSARARRSRVLRSLMARDSMTGLLNHTRSKEQLDIEVTRAQRSNTVLAFAMLDLDNFKSVNDTYGHPTGDKVIKSLARLLQQRLRKTDVIGRYGGEEFAVILTDTDGEAAVKVLNEIRESFERIRHQQKDGPGFTASFSCGVALYPEFKSPEKLSDAADQALYQAKHAGRNRVVLSGSKAGAANTLQNVMMKK